MTDQITVIEFAHRVLKHPRLAIPEVGLKQLCAMVCWRVAECNADVASRGAANNLLNTTRRPEVEGWTNFNSSGVKNYISPEQGVWQTVLTLTNGRYEDVLNGLRQNQAPATYVLNSVARTPWGTFHEENGDPWPIEKVATFCESVYNRFDHEAFALVRGFSG